MKEMDCVELTVEKDKYARDGVHKGMQGWICDDRCIQNCWLVNFPQCGEKDDIATISIKEEDLKKMPKSMKRSRSSLNAWIRKRPRFLMRTIQVIWSNLTRK